MKLITYFIEIENQIMCMRFARESKLALIEKEFDIDKVVAKIINKACYLSDIWNQQ